MNIPFMLSLSKHLFETNSELLQVQQKGCTSYKPDLEGSAGNSVNARAISRQKLPSA